MSLARLKERMNQIAMKKNGDTGTVDITGVYTSLETFV